MTTDDFDWQKFQKTLKYTDEELEIFRNDPKRAAAAKKMFSREVMENDLVVEVTHSHGCSARLKPGDKLVFKALSLLDLERSTRNWCAHAMLPIPQFASMMQDKFVAGQLDTEMVYNQFTCGDCGVRQGGWGQVVMKGYLSKREPRPEDGGPTSPAVAKKP